MYQFYLGDILLPIAPGKLTTKIKNKNKTLTLINEGEINLIKTNGLTEFSFDFLIPASSGQTKSILLSLSDLKANKKPFIFRVIRPVLRGGVLFNTKFNVSLEDYTIKEDDKNTFDVLVSIKLKEYRSFGTQKITLNKQDDGTLKGSVDKKRPAETSPAPKKSPKTYTVVRGDTLYNIAKKFYGKGSRYKDIANVNNISNPNLILVGQSLTIPV